MKMKKFIFILLSVLILAIPSFATAQSNETSSGSSPLSTICIEQFANGLSFTSAGGTVTPNATCTGSGGTSRINYTGGPGYITYDVDPYVGVYWSFIGTITITNQTSGGITTIPVSCSNAGGGSCGDTEYFSGNYGDIYFAVLTGFAEDVIGLSYTVGPCSTGFSYR